MSFSLTFQNDPKTSSPIRVHYGEGNTPVGKGVLFWDDQDALCGFAFANLQNAKAKAKDWGLTPIGEPNNTKAADFLSRLFSQKSESEKSFTLRFQATPFQQKVWETLAQVPCGETWTYQKLAQESGKPKAVRAVGTAMGKNPLSFILPCHRIVRSDGSLGNYGWGTQMKKRLLDWEVTL